MSWDAVLIAGPTASGKSQLALELAERIGGAVVNADSMQVYAELRVLTARPSHEDEARTPHFLYGHVPATERYSVGRYAGDAEAVLAGIRSAGRPPIFVGGTGLYFNALTKGLAPIPPVPSEIREENSRRLDVIGLAAFFAEFAAKDPATAAALRPGDRQRILRAASVLAATGRPLKTWQEADGVALLGGLRVARFVLAPPRDELADRIEQRFAAMVGAGALEEVRALGDLDPALPAARALGVPQLLAYLRGGLSLEGAAEAVKAETRRYAKRQMTWLRRFMADWKWLENGDLRNIISYMREKDT